MADMVANLLSGLAGALLVFALHLWIERLRMKADCMIAVVGWLDEAMRRLTDLHMSKEAEYRSNKAFLSQEDYNENSRALRSMLISSQIAAQLALACGEGHELGLLNQLKVELREVTGRLWSATASTWPQVAPTVLAHFEQVIDPMRRQLERALLRKSRPSVWLLDWRAARKRRRG